MTGASGRTVTLLRPPERVVLTDRGLFMIANAIYAFPGVSERIVGMGQTDQGSANFIKLIDPAYDQKATLERDAGAEQIAAAALQTLVRRIGPRQQVIWLLAAATILVFILSLFLGRYPALGLLDWSRLGEDELATRLVLNLRLPRPIAALLLGMTLSAAGMVFQLLFSNPLVEPGFLGVSQGAAFAIVLLGERRSSHSLRRSASPCSGWVFPIFWRGGCATAARRRGWCWRTSRCRRSFRRAWGC